MSTIRDDGFEAWWTDNPQNLCTALVGTPEYENHRRTWKAATERAAKQEREECEAIAISWSDKSFEVEQIAAEIRAKGGEAK